MIEEGKESSLKGSGGTRFDGFQQTFMNEWQKQHVKMTDSSLQCPKNHSSGRREVESRTGGDGQQGSPCRVPLFVNSIQVLDVRSEDWAGYGVGSGSRRWLSSCSGSQ